MNELEKSVTLHLRRHLHEQVFGKFADAFLGIDRRKQRRVKMKNFLEWALVAVVFFGAWLLALALAAPAKAQMPRLEFVIQQNTLVHHALACIMAEGMKNEKAVVALTCATFFDPPPHNAGESK